MDIAQVYEMFLKTLFYQKVTHHIISFCVLENLLPFYLTYAVQVKFA